MLPLPRRFAPDLRSFPNQLRAQEETRRAATALTEWGLSLRDAGELLSVSRQRVEQILKGG